MTWAKIHLPLSNQPSNSFYYAADAYRYGADTLPNSTVSSCHVPSCPIVTMQPTLNTTVWLQVMRWLASTIPNALGTVAEVENEVDLEEDDASGVSS